MTTTPHSSVPSRPFLDWRALSCRHEAGHVWTCWKAKTTVDQVWLGNVKHDTFSDTWDELRNAMAGTASVALARGWPFDMAFCFGGAMGADAKGGDNRDALVAAFKLRRPPAKLF
jgi:hypothetical protein